MSRPTFSLRALLAFVAACAAIAVVLPYFITGYHDRWTCALCRSQRIKYVYLDQNWGTVISETQCTQWYREHVEAEHEHVWIHARATALRDLYGNRFGAIDRDPVGRSIWWLTPDEQLGIYEHFTSPQKAKALFLFLGSQQAPTNHIDAAIVEKLLAWKESGYVGAWDSAESTGGENVPDAPRGPSEQ